MTLPNLIPEDVIEMAKERLWERVAIGADDECWEWQGYRDSGGYGHMRFGEKMWLVHRVAAAVSGKAPKRAQVVCHTCDNPPCCNPAHLFTGSMADNMQDMVNKGRARGRKGEDHPRRKLCEDDVRLIRNSGFSVAVLAAIFEVDNSTIYDIRNGKIWTHLNDNSLSEREKNHG